MFPVEEIHRDRAFLIEAAMGPEADVVLARLARGCRCYAVVVEGAIAGYGWLSSGPEWISELQLEIRPRKGEGYIWNCATLPDHRRRGVFRSLVAGISTAARNIGITRLWIGTLAIPGESAVPQSGFRPALTFASWTWAGIAFARHVSNVDPVLGRDGLRVISTSRGWHFGTVTRRRH
ncbi:MAG TPA: GNAT family N-acetyltransferase [Candidatus Dormibacteraeota bacterium]|nr:GNAT family N-acetyltransferase [Candidatus Dormibacteraeota bacterium]